MEAKEEWVDGPMDGQMHVGGGQVGGWVTRLVRER